MSDGHHVASAIKTIAGKRLEYRESVENPPYLSKPTGQLVAPFEEGKTNEPFSTSVFGGVALLQLSILPEGG